MHSGRGPARRCGDGTRRRSRRLLAYLNLPEDAKGTTTIESKTNFLGAARSGSVTATATPLHVGSTTIVVESVVRAGERPVAKVTQTQLVLHS